jgi:hypothetical protein
MMTFAPLDPNAPLDTLLDEVQRHTFLYFWEGSHVDSKLPYDKRWVNGALATEMISISGTGFGVMAIIVAAERGWIERFEALERIDLIVERLLLAPRFHGAFSHMIDGTTSASIQFSQYDDGGDLVETTLLLQGLICAREYFAGTEETETTLRNRITKLFDEVEWNWFTRGSKDGPLYWHWSPDHAWVMNLPIVGWNEALSAYVLGAGSDTHPITPENYHSGWARSGAMKNGKDYFGTELPLGEPFGGPLFLSQYSFCAIDPRGLTDRYGDYWQQAVAHTRINRAYSLSIPTYEQYGVWGLTASEAPGGYNANSPTSDRGAIAPAAALSSFPFLPKEAEEALRAFIRYENGKLFGDYGFADAFAPATDWVAATYLAIDQGPIVAMIENHRSGLLWSLFMKAPEVGRGLERLGFSSGHYSS